MGVSKSGGGSTDLVRASRTITANSQTLELDTSTVSVVTATTYDTCSAVTLIWEGSIDGGTSWIGLLAAHTGSISGSISTTSSSITQTAGQINSWLISVAGYTLMRARVSTYTSGSPTLTLTGKTGPASDRLQFPATANLGTLPATSATHVNSAASTNATSVKGTAGSIYNVVAFNSGAAAAYVKFYNKSSAPTVGTDVPVIVMSVAPSTTAYMPAGGWGHRFATGIAMAITGGAANSDTTAVAANQVQVSVAYI